jgi:hypothetical protein
LQRQAAEPSQVMVRFRLIAVTQAGQSSDRRWREQSVAVFRRLSRASSR